VVFNLATEIRVLGNDNLVFDADDEMIIILMAVIRKKAQF